MEKVKRFVEACCQNFIFLQIGSQNIGLVWFQTRIDVLMLCFVRVGPRPRFPGMFWGESVVILVVGEQHGEVSRDPQICGIN